jgi:ABC-type amino acid transport substrate-binding protein
MARGTDTMVSTRTWRWPALAAAIGATAVLGAGSLAGYAANAPASPAPATHQLSVSAKSWTGDFDQMIERRIIRILVPRSRTLFYIAKGRERDVTAEIVREWERAINQRYAKQLGKRPVTIVMIPTTRDQLIPGVREGRGDIAAGNITVTKPRAQLVDFLAPDDLKSVNEIVVASAKAPPVKSAEDLSGKTVHVRKTTSYYESLVALNDRLKAAGKPPVTLVLLPDALEDEDTLDMVNAGLLDLVIVDDWLAQMWAHLLPNIKLVPGAAVRTGGRYGWALRKNSPKLQAALEESYAAIAKKQGLVGYLRTQQLARVKQLRDNTADADMKRFDQMLELFKKYGAQYHFDPLMLAAQGY